MDWTSIEKNGIICPKGSITNSVTTFLFWEQIDLAKRKRIVFLPIFVSNNQKGVFVLKISSKLFISFSVIIALLLVIFLVTNQSMNQLREQAEGISQGASESERGFELFDSVTQFQMEMDDMLQHVLTLGYVQDMMLLYSMRDIFEATHQQLSQFSLSEGHDQTLRVLLRQLYDDVDYLFSLKNQELDIMQEIMQYQTIIMARQERQLQTNQNNLASMQVRDAQKIQRFIDSMIAIQDQENQIMLQNNPLQIIEDQIRQLGLGQLSLYETERIWNEEVFSDQILMASLAKIQIITRDMLTNNIELSDGREKISIIVDGIIDELDGMLETDPLEGYSPVEIIAMKLLVHHYRSQIQNLIRYMVGINANQEALQGTIDTVQETEARLATLAALSLQYINTDMNQTIEAVRMDLQPVVMAQRRNLEESINMAKVNSSETEQVVQATSGQVMWLMITMMIVCVLIFFVIFQSVNHPIKEMIKLSSELAKLDFTKEFRKKLRKDEMGQLQKTFQIMIQSVRETLVGVGKASDQLGTDAQNIVASVEENSATSEEIASNMNQIHGYVSDSVTQLMEVTSNTAELAQESQRLTQQVGTIIRSANATLEQANKDQKTINQTSDKIAGIGKEVYSNITGITDLKVITDEVNEFVNQIRAIAEQTNLLALNAAIEAARAGEAGRGFAVVADEVRKLAEESNKTAQEIGNKLMAMAETVDHVVEDAEKGAKKVETIVEDVTHITNQIQSLVQTFGSVNQSVQEIMEKIQVQSTQIVDISEKTESVGNRFGDVERTISQLNNSVQESTKAIGDLAHTAEILNQLSEELNLHIQKFRY